MGGDESHDWNMRHAHRERQDLASTTAPNQLTALFQQELELPGLQPHITSANTQRRPAPRSTSQSLKRQTASAAAP